MCDGVCVMCVCVLLMRERIGKMSGSLQDWIDVYVFVCVCVCVCVCAADPYSGGGKGAIPLPEPFERLCYPPPSMNKSLNSYNSLIP